jgi:hypothetical protein
MTELDELRKTLDELRETRLELADERRRLTDELMAIEASLGDTNRLDPETGRRMAGADYWAWRHDAMRNKQRVTRALRDVKALAAHVQQEIAELPKTPGQRAASRTRIEQKLDLLLDHFGLEWTPPDASGPNVVQEADE